MLLVADAILEKYAAHPLRTDAEGRIARTEQSEAQCLPQGNRRPLWHQKNLTTHLARHTFPTTLTLTKGVPIDSVKRMLGHRSLTSTQMYAKVLVNKLVEDMLP
ncbi:MAG TPA: hypothetical protein ENH87_18785 [Pricia antarctica]|uniref:Tyr recombinase domain-containing protein n=1 Tax=Pricia antarctica TaxID=641691 RepID=A0A831QTK5_9FLAO|nr:hypothetical protein [Pricia antarctica]